MVFQHFFSLFLKTNMFSLVITKIPFNKHGLCRKLLAHLWFTTSTLSSILIYSTKCVLGGYQGYFAFRLISHLLCQVQYHVFDPNFPKSVMAVNKVRYISLRVGLVQFLYHRKLYTHFGLQTIGFKDEFLSFQIFIIMVLKFLME